MHKKLGVIVLCWVLLLLTISVLGCKTTGGPDAPVTPVGVGSKIISCTSEVVTHNWARVYPGVMHCLTAPLESPMSCLDAIPAAIDVVGCIVRNIGRTAAMQADKNEGDVVTLRKAERSRAYIESRGLQFLE